MLTRLTRRAVLAAVLLLALAVSACGGDSSGASAPASSSTGATSVKGKLSGDPVKIGMIAPDQSQSLSLPGLFTAAKIAEASVNGAGGVDGRPLKVVTCDDHDNPQQAALCARKLFTEDKVLMLAGGLSQQLNAIYPVIHQAKSLWFGNQPSLPIDYTDPASYPFAPGTSIFPALFTVLPKGTRKIAYVASESPVSQALVKQIKDGVLEPGQELTPIFPPITTVDFQPTCLKVKQSGATVIFPAMPAPNVPAFLQACANLGLTNQTYVIGGMLVNTSVVSSVTKLKLRNIIGLAFNGPRVDRWYEDVKTYRKVAEIKDPISDVSINTYSAITLAAETLAKLDAPTTEALRAFLDEQTSFATGFTDKLDLTAGRGSQPRQFNKSMLPASVQDDKVIPGRTGYVQAPGFGE